MDINAVYREVGTYRGAAEIWGTTHKTVKRVVVAAAAGLAEADVVVRNYDVVRDLVVAGSKVTARVRGSRPRPYDVEIGVPQVDGPLAARLMDRLAGQIAGSPPFPPQVPRPADTGRFEIANSLPDLPHPMLTKAASLRLALYPDPAIGSAITQSSVPQRLAIYTMNTALMLVALPVGSAILAYNVVFGENLTVSARAIAVSGTAIGLSNSEFVLSILQSI